MLKKLWEVCRRVLSIVLNLAVVLMEPAAIRMSWEAVGSQTFTFYTENSNVFSAVICLLVVLVLAPYYPEQGGVVFLLTESSMLYHHLLNPLCVFVSFVFLERDPKLPARCIPLALVPTVLYGSVALWANIRRLIVGPYPFLMVYEQTPAQSVLWCAVILAMNLFCAWLVWRLGGNRRKWGAVGLQFR